MRYLLMALVGLSGCSTVPVAPHDSTAAAPAGDLEGLWVLQIRRQSWQPRDLEFVLRIQRKADEVVGTAAVDPVFIGRTTAVLSDLEVEGETVRFSLRSRVDDNLYRFEAQRDGGSLDGVVRWNDGRRDQAEPFTAFRREVRRFDTAIDRLPVEADPLAVGVEPVLLDRLVLGAEAARSDALIVVADGRVVAARTFGAGDTATSVGTLAEELSWLSGDTAQGLRPSDIAVIGQALLDGQWTGAPVLPDLALDGVDALLREAANPDDAWSVVRDPIDDTRPPIGFGHLTEAGEGLLVYPEARLVVVRTLDRAQNPYDRRYDARDHMGWFDEMAETIAMRRLGRDVPAAR